MAIKILHLSDIHFRHLGPDGHLDLDADLQNELIEDLKRLILTLGKIDIILIGGDIAFSGKKEEYETADKWLAEVCSIVNCEKENVSTIPGNHDVDRKAISEALADIHTMFKGDKVRRQIDVRLDKFMKSPELTSLLLAPLKNYFDFSLKYESVPSQPNKLYWEKNYKLNENILRIRGLNSALVSNSADNEDGARLIVGSMQSLMRTERGVINLILCHHPSDWLRDGNDAMVDFRNRAKLVLFGHKHQFDNIEVNGSCLVLSAGAMQPSRNEADWEPRYNVLELNIRQVLQNPMLEVKIYRRKWQKLQRQFGPEHSEKGSLFFEYDLALTPEEALPYQDQEKTAQPVNEIEMPETVIDINNIDPIRTLTFHFLGLPYSQKIRIAVELGLVDEQDQNMTEIQKAQNYMQRAIDRELLKELWDKVMEKGGEEIANPFK